MPEKYLAMRRQGVVRGSLKNLYIGIVTNKLENRRFHSTFSCCPIWKIYKPQRPRAFLVGGKRRQEAKAGSG
jgi:hypothetical protein